MRWPAGRPVIAFESTIISHGMPYPRNLETARAAEALARGQGGRPATVAVLDGRIFIGVGPSELDRLATEKGVLKASRRDLAWAPGESEDRRDDRERHHVGRAPGGHRCLCNGPESAACIAGRKAHSMFRPI